jgi:hypothetical protein
MKESEINIKSEKIKNKEKRNLNNISSPKSDEEECLGYDSKYKVIKQEEEKTEKEKSSTNSTSSQNENNVNYTSLNYSKNYYQFKYDRKMSSPICYYYDGFDKYLSETNSCLVDFSKSNNYINKETFFNGDFYKNYVENKLRPRSFGNINELNFNQTLNKNTNNSNDINNDNNLNNSINSNFPKLNSPFYFFGNFNYESKNKFIIKYSECISSNK